MKTLIVLSGAGISADSGIKTFRDSNGLWEEYDIKEVATPEAWGKNPDLVNEFYNQRRKQIIEADPNAAHLFLAQLQTQYKVRIITQNIDDLHERAGSKNVLHLHGNIRFAKSSGPNAEAKYYPINGASLTPNDLCDEGYLLRPHVVWFGEQVPEFENAIGLVEQADILLVIGTSLNVYPAAGLIHYAPKKALKIVIDPHADEFTMTNDFIRIAEKGIDSIEKLKTILNKY